MFIDDFLLQQCIFIRKYQHINKVKINCTSNKYAVIVEPRKHELLEAVCRNIMYYLPKDWNLVVISHDYDYVCEKLKDMEYIYIPLAINNLTPQLYSSLFMTEKFWNAIPGDHILIFQTDSYICRHMTNDYLDSIFKYPYIGGIYQFHRFKDEEIIKIHKENNLEMPDLINDRPFHGGNIANEYSVDNPENELGNTINFNFSINGGFSYRYKPAMLDCIKNVNRDRIIQEREKKGLNNEYFKSIDVLGEDLFFHNALDILGYELPDMDTCLEFCTNLPYKNQWILNSYSVHGYNKYFTNQIRTWLIRPSIQTLVEEIKEEFSKNEK